MRQEPIERMENAIPYRRILGSQSLTPPLMDRKRWKMRFLYRRILGVGHLPLRYAGKPSGFHPWPLVSGNAAGSERLKHCFINGRTARVQINPLHHMSKIAFARITRGWMSDAQVLFEVTVQTRDGQICRGMGAIRKCFARASFKGRIAPCGKAKVARVHFR